MSRWYRPDNPAAGLKPPREHTTKRARILERYLSPEQVSTVMQTCQGRTGSRDKAMIGLMYYHGPRASEIVGLTLGDVNLSRDGSPRLTIRGAKGGKDRVLFLVDITIGLLESWLTVRRCVARGSGPTDPLFVSYSRNGFGSGLTTDGLRHIVNGLLKDVGLYRPGLSCHAFRHAHASAVVAAGGELTALAREMGHASPETTNVYTHVVDAIRQNPAAVLAAADWEKGEEAT